MLVGISGSANTYFVVTDGGVFTCRTIYRKPIQNHRVRDRIFRFEGNAMGDDATCCHRGETQREERGF